MQMVAPALFNYYSSNPNLSNNIRLDVEGKLLLRLKQSPNGSFYEKLGLQQGDVLMMANEQ